MNNASNPRRPEHDDADSGLDAESGGVPDFFVSYTGMDRAWAEWIAWQLEAAGYSVAIQAWHFRPGENFVVKMKEGVDKSRRTLIVLSQAYFGSGLAEAEWTAAFAKDPSGQKGLLIPARIEKCNIPALLASRIYIDLAGLDEEAARAALLDGLRPNVKPTSEPHFPGKSPKFPAASSARGDSAPDLQAEMTVTSESAWFVAWFKSAMLYLATVTAYLAAATALVTVWKKFIAAPGEDADFTTYIFAGILALPLVLAFLFNLLPAVRRQRERRLRPTGKGEEGYFDTAPREKDAFGFFREGYDAFVAWAREPKSPLLHLTGLSGSGKSSLLNACLRSRLAPDTRLLVVRSYHDPLGALKNELLALWTNEPDGYEEISALDALRHAGRQLGKQERLLVAFDQFEEFFLLRAIGTEKADGHAVAAAVPVVPEDAIVPLRSFLHGFCADPPERIALLLSYREDHRLLVAPLNLSPREERRNWMAVDPLDFATASAFLRSCPGLNVPDDRMQLVLREAARQEGGRVVMRPIVANLLGIILRQMSAHPTLWRRTSDLLRGYVRDCLGGELREERTRVLRELLTDFHTARPRAAAAIARETQLDTAALDLHLENFGRAGLVRCVNHNEPSAALRIWQISHDFLATLIEHVLDALHRTLWRTLRPWLAPAAIGFVLITGFIRPWVDKQRAISFLANEGFTWNEENAEIEAATLNAITIRSLDPLASAFHRLHPRMLKLDHCQYLEDIDALKGLTSLQVIELGTCVDLENVEGLEGLTALRSLDLSFCKALQDVNVLKKLTTIQSLNLIGCSALPPESWDGLKSALPGAYILFPDGSHVGSQWIK